MKITMTILMLGCLIHLNAQIKPMDVPELEKMMKKGIKVIDIRMPKELEKTGIIPSSYRLNFYKKDGKINRDKWLNAFVRLVKGRQIKFVLVSDDGVQAKHGAKLLYDLKGYKNAYYLDGGIDAWIENKNILIKIKTKK